MDVNDAATQELLGRLLEELRALREETARNTRVLEEILAKLGSIERSQYG